MDRRKATEKGPFYLLGGLYLALVTVGFHNVAAPLAPTSLLIVAVELVVFAHLLNVYQVASLLGSYPQIPFAIELVSFGVLAWMFKLLVFPLLGGVGGFLWPHWNAADLFRNIVLEKVFVSDAMKLEAYGTALSRFFALGLVLWFVYILWHGFVLKHTNMVMNRPWLYGLGWGAWLVLNVVGLIATNGHPDWNRMISTVSILGTSGTILSGGFLVAVVAFDASYKARPLPPGALVRAYVLVTVGAGQSANVAQQLRQIPGVESADVCTGRAGIIAEVKAPASGLLDLVDKQIGKTANVTATETCVVSET